MKRCWNTEMHIKKQLQGMNDQQNAQQINKGYKLIVAELLNILQIPCDDEFVDSMAMAEIENIINLVESMVTRQYNACSNQGIITFAHLSLLNTAQQQEDIDEVMQQIDCCITCIPVVN